MHAGTKKQVWAGAPEMTDAALLAAAALQTAVLAAADWEHAV